MVAPPKTTSQCWAASVFEIGLSWSWQPLFRKQLHLLTDEQKYEPIAQRLG
jgi:hypothetical protein